MDTGTWIVIRLVALSCGAAVVIVQGLLRLVRRNPERDWQPVPGKIRDPYADGGGWLAKQRLEYTYEFAGKSYRGHQLTPLTGIWFSPSQAENVTGKRYELGASVVVYVNPRRPARAVLDPSQEPRPAVGLILIGTVFACCALFIWWKHLDSTT